MATRRTPCALPFGQLRGQQSTTVSIGQSVKTLHRFENATFTTGVPIADLAGGDASEDNGETQWEIPH